MQLGLVRRLAATVIAIISWIAVVVAAHRCFVLTGGSVPDAILRYANYLTHWTTTLDAVVFSIIALKPLSASTWWAVGQCIIMNTAMLLGYWGGVSWAFFAAQPIDLQMVHAVMPGLILSYWIFLADHQRIRVTDALAWLVSPLLYTVWIEGYGFVFGDFPYSQLNPYDVGRFGVVETVAAIFAVSAVVSFTLYAADRFLKTAFSPVDR